MNEMSNFLLHMIFFIKNKSNISTTTKYKNKLKWLFNKKNIAYSKYLQT